ncbi:RNA polymerase subunit sigma [Arthrobacter alpinus]|uniref:RNA polymerase subunit sigma n=1 Tax=Arthrobacter alpinus TaxID=656366 RepID=A0A0S2LXL2_9MICC|nr:RNA polymerase sigma factor SigE [Arthrobacter alpinus]ALO66178.1 RNA polymerase subunit sigma [Arthrobacter alpinus]
MSSATTPAARPAEVATDQLAATANWVTPSWDEVVNNHSAKVFRLAYRLTGNKFDAEDLTQEVFVRVFKSLANFKPGTLDGWLHRITTNLFLDQARRKQRIRFDALSEDATARLAGTDPGPERTFEFNNLDLDIAAALEALPPDFRAAVVLCDMEGLSYDEVAHALNIKLGTVRSRIHRGRAMLRESLADRAPRRPSDLRPARKPLLSLPRIAGAR